MEIEIINSNKPLTFDLKKLTKSNIFFQSEKAYFLFKAVAGYKPIVVVAKVNKKIIASILAVIISETGLKKHLSKRCIIWGGPVFYEELSKKNEVFSKMLSSLNRHHSAIYTEWRNLTDNKSFKDAFLENGFSFHEHLNYIVKVSEDETESLKRLNTSKRRQVRKSIKQGATISKASSMEEVRKFYKILSELYRTKVKKPLPQLAFFETFFKQEQGVFLMIYKQKELLGGIRCPIDQTTIYEWYIAGLDDKYNNIYPSVLVTWAPIAYATKNGLKYFDFLGAGKPDEDYGVREFKSKFGGELVEYGRYKRINKPLLYKIGLLGLKILQKISS